MKFTLEELHEINQMIDLQLNNLMRNYMKVYETFKDDGRNSFMQMFHKNAIIEYHRFMTIRAKVNNNGGDINKSRKE